MRTARGSGSVVPHFVDSVGKGNRIDRFTKVKARAMLTVCGTKEWSKRALQVAQQQRAPRAQ
eukprot:1380567-Alexandrium_andersonii.AAC.1